MDTITFDKLLLKTAFCCMASDGHIDKKEVEVIKSLCSASLLFQNFNFSKELNILIEKLNARGTEFISYYFDLLKTTTLTEEEELNLIHFAVDTINADEKLEYSEIKFFKVIRSHLKVSNEVILSKFPDMDEMFLEEDIMNENYLNKLKADYFGSSNLPQFEMIQVLDDDFLKSVKDE